MVSSIGSTRPSRSKSSIHAGGGHVQSPEMPTLLPSLPTGFGVSVVAHVGLALMATRLPAARLVDSAPAPESRVEIEIAEPLETEAADPTAVEPERPVVRSSRIHRHHHPYEVPPDHDAIPHDPRIVHAAAAVAPPSEVATGAAIVAELPAPRFVLAAVGRTSEPAPPGTAPTAGPHGLPAGVGVGEGGALGAGVEGDAVFAESPVTSRARLLTSVPPVYPAAARQAEIEADVPLEIVVDTMGRVTSAVAVQGGALGLDEAARSAVARYRFAPALRDGRPVRVRMRWVVQFRLR